jgi:hypothetical protein
VLDRVVFQLLFANNGVDFNTKLRDVDRSSRKDFFINEQVELFNGGFKLETGLKTKDTFRFNVQNLISLMYMRQGLSPSLTEIRVT